MTIFYSVRVKVDTLPAFISEEKLAVFAQVQGQQYTKAEAEKIAKERADFDNCTYEVWKVEERFNGYYRPKGNLNGRSVLENSQSGEDQE